MVIRHIVKIFRRQRKGECEREAQPVPMPSVVRPVPATSGVITIWESELRVIAAESAAWAVETGGDLFGRWQGTPTIFLATKAGPNAQRDKAHFRLDVDYLRKLSEPLASDWALRYFGDWHSHHRLGLSAPSSGDRRRIRQVGERNQFPAMAEIIVTTEGSQGEPSIRIYPWLYELTSGCEELTALCVKVLPGISPIRQALIVRSEFPEQELCAWEAVPLDRVRIGDERDPPPLQGQADADGTTRDRTLLHLNEALKQASGNPVEQHSTAFGYIVVAKLQEPLHLAFAIDGRWPMNVLEVHRLNRDAGTTEPINAPDGLTAPNITGIVEMFRDAMAGGIA